MHDKIIFSFMFLKLLPFLKRRDHLYRFHCPKYAGSGRKSYMFNPDKTDAMGEN